MNKKETEEIFHDGWANSIDILDIMVDEAFEACSSPENKIILNKLGNVEGKKILELGCGAGEASVYFAKMGALVTSTDISKGMLNLADKLAKAHHVLLTTNQSSSDKIGFEDNSFDIVYAANLLHHVDMEDTIKEVKRVLKPNGIFVGFDPLAHNTLINIYRKIATDVRTKDEHPLNISDVKIFEKYFSEVTYDVTWFFTLFIFLKYFFIDGVNPNKERYWKKIIIEHEKIKTMHNFLEKLDIVFLKKFPFLKKYCWNIVFVCRK